MELRGGGSAQGPVHISALKTGTALKRVNGWTKVLQSNGIAKQAGFVILISDKIDVKLKLTRREKKRDSSFSTKKQLIKKMLLSYTYTPHSGAPNVI